MITKYNVNDIVRMVSDLSSEIELDKSEIARLRARSSKVVNNTTSETGGFTKVDPRVIVLTVSGTNGNGTYSTAQTIDFNTAVPSTAKKVWLQIVIIGTNLSGTDNTRGFKYTPDGWTDPLEQIQYGVVGTSDLRDELIVPLPLSSSNTGTVSVWQIENGVGDAYSYAFEVFGYE